MRTFNIFRWARNRVYIDVDKGQAPDEVYPSNSQPHKLRFIEFELLRQLGKFPPTQYDHFTVPLHQINRSESVIIYISHTWLTELSSVPDQPNFSHPDNRNGNKFDLCIHAILHIWQSMLSNKVKACYVWIDYSCTQREIKNASDVHLAEIMEVVDVMLTPIVDFYPEWQLPCGVVDWYEDYRAKGWAHSQKSYLNRGWCRTEMMFAACTPVPRNDDGTERADLYRHALAHQYRCQRRPHLLYGTRERTLALPPILLPPLQPSQYGEYSPLEGYYTGGERDKAIVQELLDLLRIDKKTPTTPLTQQSAASGDPTGYGERRYPNGNLYKGDFVQDRREGHGCMQFANGDVFEGAWRADQIHGQGTMTYADGSVYVGEWAKNARCGEGVLEERHYGEAASERRYVGTFVNDKQEGRGCVTYAQSGHVYEGEFKDGCRHGTGVLRDSQGCLIFEGAFEGDQFHGYGMLNYPNGDHYRGMFELGVRHGSGRLTLANTDERYRGIFENDVLQGAGENIRGEETYTGTFLNGLRHGEGVIQYQNGDVFTGRFLHDLPTGAGELHKPNGRTVFTIDGKKRGALTALFGCCIAGAIIGVAVHFGMD